MNDERERVKEKIVKLLNVTREKGASENEAIVAAERAAALMAHFDITTTELEIRSVESIEKTVAKRRYGNLQIAVWCSVLYPYPGDAGRAPDRGAAAWCWRRDGCKPALSG
jgi:hypothetical protein